MNELLLAQNFMMANVIILLCIGLGVLAAVIPRPRKPFDPNPKKEGAVKKSVRHQAAGSRKTKARYGLKK